ncbi:PREDICTED: diuretic hormone class 2 isoform X1 [Papilio polytes]|uniref:diuretic hormone class 2 isoform X1 n=1 Tax=Papilio polytes TaxID=76194 RepID=UPI000675F862|nr:PREDICTED: diuretic hormone class 2 isoform X1 [Papilio polytes]
MVRPTCLLVCCLLGALMLVVPAASYPRFVNDYRQDVAEDPEEIREMLSRLESLIQLQRQMDYYKDGITSEKRALDLGLTRGYSGALQAKHLMGLAAANFAGGPGRRRRDAH